MGASLAFTGRSREPMIEPAGANLKHVLCALILIARIGDIGTTYLVTPTMALEANPLMRRLGWRFALLTMAVCAVPYVSVDAGLMILVPSLLVSASNASKIWAARTMGERQYGAMLVGLAARSRLRQALAPVFASTFFIFLLGAVVIVLYPDPNGGPAFWMGAGIVTYGIALALHSTLALVRLFKVARATAKPESGRV
jgi:hypothetical protein